MTSGPFEQTDFSNKTKKKMLLCRVADSLFWMSRYIERAENTARLVDVNLQLLLETNGTDHAVARHWEAILQSTEDLALFRSLFSEITSETVMEFYTFNRENPSSVISCVYSARENARMIRDQIAEEMWLVINRAYLFLKGQNAQQVWESGPNDFYEQVKEYTILFQGLTDGIFPHNVGFEFLKCGNNLERAEKIARILDSKHYMLLPGVNDVGGAVDMAGWFTVLRACCAREAYQRTYVQDVTARNVADLLINSNEFPRSIYYSMHRFQLALHAISGCPITHFSNEAERMTGRLMAELNYTSTDEIIARGLHETLADICARIAQIALELSNRYMFFPIVDPAANIQEAKQTLTQA